MRGLSCAMHAPHASQNMHCTNGCMRRDATRCTGWSPRWRCHTPIPAIAAGPTHSNAFSRQHPSSGSPSVHSPHLVHHVRPLRRYVPHPPPPLPPSSSSSFSPPPTSACAQPRLPRRRPEPAVQHSTPPSTFVAPSLPGFIALVLCRLHIVSHPIHTYVVCLSSSSSI